MVGKLEPDQSKIRKPTEGWEIGDLAINHDTGEKGHVVSIRWRQIQMDISGENEDERLVLHDVWFLQRICRVCEHFIEPGDEVPCKHCKEESDDK